MTTKLKIDLSQGILEVEGSETFVKTIYQDFKVQFLGEEAAEGPAQPARRRRSRKPKPAPAAEPQKAKPEALEPEAPAEPLPKPKITPSPAYTFIQELDLSASANHPSLVEFMDSKFPITNEERNLVFLYYLQYIAKQKSITLDHVYTCYRKANIRAPLNIEHSVQMTVDHHGWLRIAKNGNLSVTPAGKRYVENQLPKKMKS